MSGTHDDHDRDIAQWLLESGRRPAPKPDESPEELLSYLEKLADTRLRTRQDVLEYFEGLNAREPRERLKAERARATREYVLITLLGVAVAQYYFLDVGLQIASMQRMFYFVPVAADHQRS